MERANEKRQLSMLLAESIRRQPRRSDQEWRDLDAIIETIPDSDPHKLEVRQARLEARRETLP
ncbi:MAG: hypothetical protein ACK6D3_07080 [Planctomycetaceae bacterium]|jgi:hypothetical protein